MTDKIEPVLSAEEWADLRNPILRAPLLAQLGGGTDPRAIAQTITILNDALPDSDPRKITREMIEGLRNSVDVLGFCGYPWRAEQVQSVADALASYLPPE